MTLVQVLPTAGLSRLTGLYRDVQISPMMQIGSALMRRLVRFIFSAVMRVALGWMIRLSRVLSPVTEPFWRNAIQLGLRTDWRSKVPLTALPM